MKWTRPALVCALGFFALAAQTVLFRAFLSAFEGNELAVGAFFGSWLAWVGLGAALARLLPLSNSLERGLGGLTLCWAPLFVAQLFLIQNIRALAGVASYELFPLARMLVLSALLNAPVSAFTGLLFTLACRAFAHRPSLPVARVYAFESAGAFLGGVSMTVLFGMGISQETAVLIALLPLTGAAGLYSFASVDAPGAGRRRRIRTLALAPFAVAVVVLVSGLGPAWARFEARTAWRRLLPAASFTGFFTTAQSAYLYGQRGGQFVVMMPGGVCETLPNAESAAEAAVLGRTQVPRMRDVLVVGSGSAGLCEALRAMPGTERVVWMSSDPEYPRRLRGVLPERFVDTLADIETPEGDIRAFLEESGQEFDLVLLNLPDVTTLVLNRYTTAEFFDLVARRLAPSGVVGLRTTGAANYLGGELAALGASGLVTLESVFENVVVKPGDDTWFFASNADYVSEDGAVLRERLREIDPAGQRYPPEALAALYPPDRIRFQRERYAEVAALWGPDMLHNSDGHPKALLYTLLVALRRGGRISLGATLPVLVRFGAWLGIGAMLLYGLLRGWYLYGERQAHRPSRQTLWDAGVLVAAAGLCGMALTTALMFRYQSDHGSLFLAVGLIASHFMAGAALGAWLMAAMLTRTVREPVWLLPLAVLGHLFVLLFVASLPHQTPHVLFLALFFVSGAVTGLYFPIAALRLERAGFEAGSAGGLLEMLDHSGGACGAVATGLLMLPVFGVEASLAVLAALLAAQLAPLPACIARRAPVAGADLFDRWSRRTAFLLGGVACLALFTFHAAEWARPDDAIVKLRLFALGSAPEGARVLEEDGLADERFVYFAVGAEPAEAYVFHTRPFADDVTGYGGSVDVAAVVSPDGELLDAAILQSNETPSYLEMLEPWLNRLEGEQVFSGTLSERVDSVSGATLTSQAVLRALDRGAPAFAAAVLGGPVPAPERATAKWRLRPGSAFLALALFTAAALILRQRPSVWTRRAFLAAVFLVLGVWYNAQFASVQPLALLAGDWPPFQLNAPAFLFFFVPVLVLLFGNVYCGYLCPFGAVQELLGDMGSRRPLPRKSVWRYGRFAKYLLFVVLLLAFVAGGGYAILEADPLTTFFGRTRTSMVLLLAAASLFLAFRFNRFWCRNLCPAGAFLALLNGIRWPRQLLRRAVPFIDPPIRPLMCDLGVRAAGDFDCIRCDRCRTTSAQREPDAAGAPWPNQAEWGMLAAALVAGIMLAVSAYTAWEPEAGMQRTVQLRASGAVRDVDAARIRRLVESGRLSGHEAEYYQPADDAPAADL